MIWEFLQQFQRNIQFKFLSQLVAGGSQYGLKNTFEDEEKKRGAHKTLHRNKRVSDISKRYLK